MHGSDTLHAGAHAGRHVKQAEEHEAVEEGESNHGDEQSQARNYGASTPAP